ncbi:MAG: DNA-3-methyladenine glycosylase 2 family protein [Ruminococcaceae bacterium]|nr:DNA-3-methyladenine glycosylase 2 family protein [Oscillospiraceae bacterium]
MFSTRKKDNGIELYDLDHFSIEKIFDCGQCFRFNQKGNTVEGVAFGKFITLEQTSPSSVVINGVTDREFETLWKNYFALDLDYSGVDSDILLHLKDDSTIQKAIEFGNGIRLLRQDGWEALCSFIISQNNNIPRIKKIIENMSKAFGEKIDDDHYAFPTAEALYEAGVDKIFELKTGFRAKYIYDAAEKVATGKIDLSLIKDMPTNEAAEYLMQIKGVGIKVASCALLFGFDKTDAFPVDVWVKRVLEKYYPDGLDITSLGNFAGMIQQYLFYYERYNK